MQDLLKGASEDVEFENSLENAFEREGIFMQALRTAIFLERELCSAHEGQLSSKEEMILYK